MKEKKYQKRKTCIIVDLDGTIANTKHRAHFLHDGPKKDWESYFKACKEDTPNEHIIALCRVMYDGGARVIICSGRPNNYRLDTEWWFRDVAKLLYNRLLMRAVNDRRPDTVVKAEMLQKLRDEGFNVVLAIDDRPSVLKMWQDNGVPVLAVMDPTWPKQGEEYVPQEVKKWEWTGDEKGLGNEADQL